MRSVARALVTALLVAAGVGLSPTAHAVSIGDTEGCTPGYWKVEQHWDSWQEATPTTSFVHAFRMAEDPASADMTPVGYITSSLTMVEALNGKGGSTLDGARQILARAAAAAWLNAAYDDGDQLAFPWRRWAAGLDGRPALVPTVVAALSGTDRQAMLDLAAQLDEDNNLGCPLS